MGASKSDVYSSGVGTHREGRAGEHNSVVSLASGCCDGSRRFSLRVSAVVYDGHWRLPCTMQSRAQW